MGLFSFTQEIAIDLGTANTIITCNDKIVVDEPSVVAISMADNKMVAVGRKAQQMIGRGGNMVRTVRPLKDGVIADFYACEMMIRGMIKLIPRQSKLFSPQLRMVVGIPSSSTEVEIRAVRDSSEHAGGRDVYMIFEPMAAAIGMGIDVEAAEGCMVVDIGGGTTEIAVISLGGIVTSCSIRIGGDEMDSSIIQHIKREYNLLIGERTAEEIKINIGTAIAEPSREKTMDIRGRDLVSGLPKTIKIVSSEICSALSEPVQKIVDAVKGTLEKTPPELAADVMDHGIMMTGGGSLLTSLDKLLSRETGMPVLVSEDALSCVGEGTGRSLENIELLKRVVMTTKKLR